MPGIRDGEHPLQPSRQAIIKLESLAGQADN